MMGMGKWGSVALSLPAMAPWVVAGALSAAPSFADEEWDVEGSSRSIEVKVDEATTVDLQLPPGEIHVDGTDGDMLKARMVVRCSHRGRDCERAADAVDFFVEADDDRVLVETEGWKTRYSDSSHLLVEVEVPKARRVYVSVAAGSLAIAGIDARSLDVRLKAGELRIREGTACPRVDVLAGDVRVELPEPLMGSVHVDAGIGDAELITPDGRSRGHRSWLIGSEVDWDRGSGDCDADIDVQVGEVRVELVD